MASSLTKIDKGLSVQKEGQLNPAAIDIIPAGTAATKTTITSSQTGNITLNLPSEAGTFATQEYVAANSVASYAVDSIPVEALNQAIQLTSANETIIKVTNDLPVGTFTSDNIVFDVTKSLSVASPQHIEFTVSGSYSGSFDYSIPAADNFTQLDNTYLTGSAIEITGVVNHLGTPSYQDISLPDVTTISLGWEAIIKDNTTGDPIDWNGIYSYPYSNTIYYDDTVKETVKVRSISITDNTAAGWEVVNFFKVRLPNVTTLSLNQYFTLKNLSSSSISVFSFDEAAVLYELPTLSTVRVTCTSISDNSTAGWSTRVSGSIALPTFTPYPLTSFSPITNTLVNSSPSYISVNDSTPAVDKEMTLADSPYQVTTQRHINVTGTIYQQNTVILPDVATIPLGTEIFVTVSNVLIYGVDVKPFGGGGAIGSVQMGKKGSFRSISITANDYSGWEINYEGPLLTLPLATTVSLGQTFTIKNNLTRFLFITRQTGDQSYYQGGINAGETKTYNYIGYDVADGISSATTLFYNIDNVPAKAKLPNISTLSSGRLFTIENKTEHQLNVSDYNGVYIKTLPRNSSTNFLLNESSEWEDSNSQHNIEISNNVARVYTQTANAAIYHKLIYNSPRENIKGANSAYNTYIKLPDVTTLEIDQSFIFKNMSPTGGYAVNSYFDGGVTGYIWQGESYKVTCISNTDNGSTGWESELISSIPNAATIVTAASGGLAATTLNAALAELEGEIAANTSAISGVSGSVSSLSTSVTALNLTEGNTSYVSGPATVTLTPSNGTTTKTHTFWSVTTLVQIRTFGYTGQELVLNNETNGPITVTYDAYTPESNAFLTIIRPNEAIRITRLSYNYAVNIERMNRYSVDTGIITSGGTTALTWLSSSSQLYNVSGTGGTILLPPSVGNSDDFQKYEYYVGREVRIYNQASGNVVIKDSSNTYIIRTLKSGQQYSVFKASGIGASGWVVDTYDTIESGSSVGYINGQINPTRDGSNINLPANLIVQDSNLKFLKTGANSANTNYGGYIYISASNITANSIIGYSGPDYGGGLGVQVASQLSSHAYGLTSGSVTYNAATYMRYIRENHRCFVDCHIKLASITSPVNVALKITGLPFTSATGGTQVDTYFPIRVHNGTITGQLWGKVVNNSTEILLYAVNNGTETAISAATFLAANTEISFSMNYRLTGVG